MGNAFPVEMPSTQVPLQSDFIQENTTGDSIMKYIQPSIRCIVSAGIFLFSLNTTGQENDTNEVTVKELVVSASRVPLPPKQVGSSITVINREDIEDRKPTTVYELLREVPSVAVSSSGGSQVQARIRGAEANHTLVVLDGIKLNDPYFGNELYLHHLPVQLINRVEVLRGPQSSIYGSDAVGGVVNLTTPKYSKNSRPSIQAGLGTHSASNVKAIFGAANDSNTISLALNSFRTDGISAAKSGTEKDGTRMQSALLKAGSELSENLEVAATAMVINSKFEFDGSTAADTDQVADNRKIFLALKAVLSQMDGNLNHTFKLTNANHKRVDVNQGVSGQNSIGKLTGIEYQANYRFQTADTEQTIIFAASREKTKYQRTNSTSQFVPNIPNLESSSTSYTLEHQASLSDRVFLSLSGRYDDNSKNTNAFKNYTTWRASGAYLLGNGLTRIHASYGTGIKNPTITELYGFSGTFVGNPDLKPETSKGWDIGVEHTFSNDGITVDATYFDNRITNEIKGFGNCANPPECTQQWAINLDGTNTTKGLEFSASGKFAKYWKLAASLTLSKPRDNEGQKLVRRSDLIASLNLNRSFTLQNYKGEINFNIQHNGKQTDVIFPPPDFSRTLVELRGYTLVNLAGSLNINEQTSVFAKVENALDETDYEEVAGYGVPGRAFFVGVNYEF